MNNDWWKMMRKKIPGCEKFKDKGIQNEDELKVMFEDLRNTDDDHFGASSNLIPQSAIHCCESVDSEPESDPEEITLTSKGKGKRLYCNDKEKTKRAKTSRGKWIEVVKW